MNRGKYWILIFLIVIIFILIVLEFLNYKTKDKFRHAVDYKRHLSQHILQKNIDSVMLSDSVTHEVMGQFKLNNNILDLTTNMGVSLAGNYFLLQRYLKQHKPPAKVYLFFTYGLFSNSLNLKHDYLYFTTVFTDKEEINELTNLGKENIYNKLDYFNIRKSNIKKYLKEYIPGEKAIFNRNYNLNKLQNKTNMAESDKRIEVFSEAKLFSFADYFLKKIIESCNKNNIELSLVVEPMPFEQHGVYKHSELYVFLKKQAEIGLYDLIDANDYYQFDFHSFRADKVHLKYDFQKKYLDIIDQHIVKLFTYHYDKRIKDLSMIHDALKKYYNDNGNYPRSTGFDGLYAQWGESRKDWIQGLAPKYIDTLPRDPKKHKNPKEQYFYRSNGQEYKLIAHGVEDCKTVKSINPKLIDPKRDCWAYGYWTEGASKW